MSINDFFLIKMSSHFKWYPSSEDRVVPWNSTYEFPSQANKSVKITPRIPPKNGAVFTPGNTIRLEFPAQGYVNPAMTTIEFDVEMKVTGGTVEAQDYMLRFQNNINSIFSRARLMYGSSPVEDLIQAGVLVRQLTEWTNSSHVVYDQTSIAEGIAGSMDIYRPTALDKAGFKLNGRQFAHGITVSRFPTELNLGIAELGGPANPSIIFLDPVNNASRDLTGSVTVPGSGGLFRPATYGGVTHLAPAGLNSFPTVQTAVRRYQIQLPMGIFQQGKLIPTKFMASQLSIELTLATPAACMLFYPKTAYPGATVTPVSPAIPTYSVMNVNLIPEILEMDASYDAYFLEGLQKGGVPIQFASWNTFVTPQGGSSNNTIVIQERSRSVKSVFAIIRLANDSLINDMGATFAGLGGTIDSYQYRIGGRYFPASPVICSAWETTAGSHNGAPEAFTELQKALGTLGDSRLSTSMNAQRWAMPLIDIRNSYTKVWGQGAFSGSGNTLVLPDFVNCSDGFLDVLHASNGPLGTYQTPFAVLQRPGASSSLFSSIFAMACNLETTNGREISGLNAEEQSDISLSIKFSGHSQAADFNIEVYTYYDSMMILRENNVIELIQ